MVSVPPLRGRLGGGWCWKAVHIYHEKLLRQWFLPITSAPSRSQTHPNLTQGQPILTFPKGRHRWPCQWTSAPSRSPPLGRCRLLRIVKDRLVQVKDLLVLVTLVDVSNVSFHWDFCAVLGKQRAHLGQARCPTWVSTLPHFGTFAARMSHICPQ